MNTSVCNVISLYKNVKATFQEGRDKNLVIASAYKSKIFAWPRVDYYGLKESVFKKKTIGPRKRPMVIVVTVPRGCTRDEDRPLGLLSSPLR